jgi:hypothetical protein
VHLTTLTLGSNGTISNVHTVTLASSGDNSVNAKRVYGGAQAVPDWAQKAFGCGPYVVGFGGYTSLVLQGGGASIGPTAYCIPDPASYPDNAAMPFRTLLDASSSRGLRKSIPLNYFDGGDPRQNPPTRPTSPPVRSAQWLSPNAQGLGWMVWGDSYYNTGMTLPDGSFCAIASMAKGRAWYQSSTLAFDGRQFEIHIWDPATLGNGPLTRPATLTELPFSPTWFPEGNLPAGNLGGATYDEVGHSIYLWGCPFGPDEFTCRVFQYAVAN